MANKHTNTGTVAVNFGKASTGLTGATDSTGTSGTNPSGSSDISSYGTLNWVLKTDTLEITVALN